MLSHRWLLPLLLALGQGKAVCAQPPILGSPLINNFGPEVYKGNPQVWTAVQDSRGVMFFATSSGLLEFDGQHWRSIPVPGKAITRGLAIAQDGTLFYGSVGDFGYLALEKGNIKAVSLKDKIPEAYRNFNEVWQILSTRDGVYILSKARIFRITRERVHVVGGRLANCHPCVMNDAVFYQDQDKGLCVLRGDEALPLPLAQAPRNDIRVNLAPLEPHRLLLLTADGKMQTCDLGSYWDEKKKRYAFEKRRRPIKGKCFSRELEGLVQDNSPFSLYNLHLLADKTLAIGTLQLGLILMDHEGHIKQQFDIRDGLIDNSIFDVTMDRTRNLWVTTNHGISYVESNSPVSVIGEKHGLTGTTLSVVEQGKKLYFGTFQDTFLLSFDKTPWTLERLKKPLFEAWDFKEVGSSLMAATGHVGLVEIRDRKVMEIDRKYANGYCLIQPSRLKNHVIMGTAYGAVCFKKTRSRLSSKKSSWKALGRIEGLEAGLRNFAEDANGHLWASTDASGILRLRFPSKNPRAAILDKFGPEQGLPELENMRVFAHGNQIYVTTSQGIYQYDLREEAVRFTPETTFGRPLQAARASANYLCFPNASKVWVSSNKGLYSATLGSPETMQFENVHFKSIPNERFFVTREGLLILPGKPTYILDPGKKERFGRSFKTLIRGLTAKNGPLFLGTHAQPETTFGADRTLFTASQPRPRKLKYPQESLTFEFAAPYFERPESLEFQYILQGAESAWSDWTSNSKKEYTFLPPGPYQFKVKARNFHGREGDEAVYAFRILPPWYRTWWAQIAFFLTGWAFIYGLLQYLTLRLRKQRLVLEKRVQSRTEELHIAKEVAEKAREKAEQASAFKSAFLANTSHELRTPLNAILGFMHILTDGKVSEEDRRRYHRIVLNSSESLLQIVEDLLDLSKIEAGRLDVMQVPFQIRLLVEDVLGILDNRAKEKNISLLATIESHVPTHLMGDPHRIKQIMINLLGNSIKFTHKGQVSLHVAGEPLLEEWTLKVTVEDTGLGIAPDVLPRLFTAFAQGDSDAKRMGTGLGLSISKQLAELMGGTVGATSELGKGSRFWFTFLAKEGTRSSDEAPTGFKPVPASGKAHGRLLYADDNPSNRTLMGAMLAQLDLECVLAEDGQEALERFLKEPFDLVLLDGRMPRLDGAETLKKLRQSPRGQDTPVILFTAMAELQNRAEAQALGFDDVLKKPVELADFKAVVLSRLRTATWDAASQAQESAPTPERAKSVTNASASQLDATRLNNLYTAMGGLDGMADFLEGVLLDCPSRVERIQKAFISGDMDLLSREAHDLKSNAANVGLILLSEQAARLEYQGARASQEDRRAWIGELATTLPQALEALVRWMVNAHKL